MQRIWNTAYAAVIGTSHINKGQPCQDSAGCRVLQSTECTEFLLMVVADGAGSASRSEFGASLTVERFLSHFGALCTHDSAIEKIDREYVINWLESLKSEIVEQASLESIHPREFSCTINGAIIGPEYGFFLQIGDGAIVVSEEETNEYGYIFWPQHGEFANQTHFLFQENISETLEFVCIQKKFDRLALFSDGLERLILDFSSRSVHPPSLDSIFKWLQKCSENEAPSTALATYLNSDFINRRTDDDKSLVMAVSAIP